MRKPGPVTATLLSAAFLLLSLSVAWAQSARAIKLINPYPPGGGADVLARVLVNQIGNMGGPTLVVENRPGAGTVIGTQDAVRTAPHSPFVADLRKRFVEYGQVIHEAHIKTE
jgi:tripartite-type tricarboxylate transporter receptor subunit TctC